MTATETEAVHDEPEPDEPGTPEDELEIEDDETEEDGEIAAEAPPAPIGMTEADAERAFKAVERSFKTYEASIGRNLDFLLDELTPCPLCSPLAHPAFVNITDAGRVPDDVTTAVQRFLGLARETEYETDSQTHECAACHGLGKTRTGSRVPGNETRTCRTCLGYGFTPPPTDTAPGAGAVKDSFAPVDEVSRPLSEPDRDMWGEARILPDGRVNPNYGKLPQHKIMVAPWGVTANLTAQDDAGA